MAENALVTVLIVDDEPDIRTGLRGAIDWDSLGVTFAGGASDGAEALALMKTLAPDIVLTDIRMPVMDGLTLIHRAEEAGMEACFILISGYDDFEYAREAIQYGVRDYLLKPIVPGELNRVIVKTAREVLARRALSSKRRLTDMELREASRALRARQLIPDILQGVLSVSEIERTLAELELPVRNAPLRAAIFKCLRCEDAKKSRAEIERALLNAFSALSPMPYDPGDGRLMLIYNIAPNEDGDAQTAYFLAGIRRAEEEIGQTIVSAVGKRAPSLSELAVAYDSATQALGWLIYEQLRPLITSDVLSLASPPPAGETLNTGALLATIRNGDEKRVRAEALSCVDALLYIPTPPPNYLYAMCNYLLISVQKELSEYTRAPIDAMTDDYYMALRDAQSVRELKKWMCDTLVGFMRYVCFDQLRRTDPIIEKAVSYIQARMPGAIRIEDVGSHVGFSRNYFTTYFKNKTGQNFRDYVLDAKIVYAQKQLRLRGVSLASLSNALGYEDYRSFNRAFKARSGVSPSEYRARYFPAEEEDI